MPVRDATRERLVHAAAQLLWERTYQTTSVDDLCAHAKAKKGSFYYYFPTKIDLAIAAVETAWAQTKQWVMEPVFTGEVSGLAQLQTLVDRVEGVQAEAFKKAGAYLGCPFGGLGQEMAHQDERLRSALKGVFDGHCEFMQGAVLRAVEQGEVPAGDARRRAENLFALFEGALLLAKVGNDPSLFRAIVSSSIRPLASS